MMLAIDTGYQRMNIPSKVFIFGALLSSKLSDVIGTKIHGCNVLV
jgi:hypothetical protein